MLFVNNSIKILVHFELGWNQQPILQRIHRGQSSLQLRVVIRPFDEAHTFPFFPSSFDALVGSLLVFDLLRLCLQQRFPSLPNLIFFVHLLSSVCLVCRGPKTLLCVQGKKRQSSNRSDFPPTFRIFPTSTLASSFLKDHRKLQNHRELNAAVA